MAYSKQTWHDEPTEDTPISAARLGHIEDGIEAAASTADSASATAAAHTTALAGKQPLDADLTAVAALDSTAAGVIASDGAGWVGKTYTALKTALGLVKADVGLGNVDNTADTAKPVSTAQQTALNLKADLASPALTGNPTAPTQTAGNNSTRVATTAFVATAVSGTSTPLAPTAVKTSAYTAAVNDVVPVNTTSGNVTITLPTAPADKAQVAVKHVIRGGTNTVTIACGGSDVLNKTGGSTSAILTLVNQSVTFQYQASGGIWYVLGGDLPLSGLDSRFDAAGAATTATTTAAADATAKVNSARLNAGYGSVGGVPISPEGALAAPALGPNLFLSPTTGLGAGYSTATSGSLTANSTNQTLIWRIAVGSISGNSGSNGDQCLRLIYDFSNSIVAGWSGIYLRWVDSAGTQIAGTTDLYLTSTPTSALANLKGVLELKQPAGNSGVSLHVVLETVNNASSGTVTLNSMDIRRVAFERSPLVVGWVSGTPNAASGTCRIMQPLVDPVTRVKTWKSTDLGTDGALETAVVASNAYQGLAFSNSPVSATGSKTGATPSVVFTSTASAALHINNISQVMGIINGSGNQEIRCNTHGGETGRTGTYATDFTYEYDLGDGTWRTMQAILTTAQTCKRFRFTQHTKVFSTTSGSGSPFANVDYVWTFFDDGTTRCDRTVTFLTAQAMYIWFLWMITVGSGSVPNFVGRIGAGENIHGQVDYRSYVTTPVIASVSTSTTGGSLPAVTTAYRITRRTALGESLPSAAVSQASTGTTSVNTITFPASVTGQTGWGVYNASGLLGYVPVAVTTFADSGTSGPGPQPPTVSSAAYNTAVQASAQSSNANWAVYKEIATGVCLSTVVDQDQIVAQFPSATCVRGEILQGSGITKNYWHLEAAGGGALPASNAQANGFYPVTIGSGTVIANTSWLFAYLPKDPILYEKEQTVRASNVSSLATIYPST